MIITTIIILFYHGGTISDTQNQEYCLLQGYFLQVVFDDGKKCLFTCPYDCATIKNMMYIVRRLP